MAVDTSTETVNDRVPSSETDGGEPHNNGNGRNGTRSGDRPVVTPPDDDLPDDPEALKEMYRKQKVQLQKSNRENAERRHREEERERQEEDRKNAALGETDRLKKENATLNQKLSQAEKRAEEARLNLERKTVDGAVERLATIMGFEYPDIVPSLINRDRVTIDENGDVQNVKSELERLAKTKPGLLNANKGAGTPPRDHQRRNDADNAGNRDNKGRRQATVEEELDNFGDYDY